MTGPGGMTRSMPAASTWLKTVAAAILLGMLLLTSQLVGEGAGSQRDAGPDISAKKLSGEARGQLPALDPAKRISQYAHTAWRIQDGVLPGLPEAITQTTDGYLWIGTFAGLVRFDGVRLVHWNGPELPDSRIFSVLGARDGSLWIGTPRGLAQWKDGNLATYAKRRGKTGTILEDHAGNIWVGRSDVEDTEGPLCEVAGAELQCHGESDGIPFNSANRIAEDQEGNIWVAGFAGLTRWKPGSSETYFRAELKKTDVLVGALTMAVAKDGTIWAGVEREGGGLEIRRLVQGVWTRFEVPGIKGADLGVTRLFADRDQSMWIGTARRGIYRVHGDKVDHFDSGDGLSSDAIAGFFQDREGTLWVATSKGVDSFRDLRVATFSLREGLTADSVSSVLASRSGRVWIGNSGALDYVDGDKLSAIATDHGLPGRDIISMFEDHAGQLWVGIDRKLWVYDGKQFRLIDPEIAHAITEDTDHNIWARLAQKLVRIRDFKIQESIDLQPATSAFKLAADPGGGIWLGRVNGDLARYRNGQTEVFPSSHGPKSMIRALLTGQDGSVWAATQEGLVRWKQGTRRLLTSHNGLPCDDIYTVVDDAAGSLWLYASCGVIAVPKADLDKWWDHPEGAVSARTFDGFDGAQPGLTPHQPQAARSADGRLWFANDSILQMIDPSRLGRNTLPPPVHIEEVVADKKSYPVKGGIALPPGTGDLEIDYTALSLAVPEKVRYRYKLEGHDRNWQEPGTRREAFYNDLAPGRYTFRVMACNNDGVWNEDGAAVQFDIIPAFYQTDWFLLLSVTVVAYLGWASYRWRVGQISRRMDLRFDERLAERTRIAQDLHDTLLQGVLSASMQLHVANEQLPADSAAKPLVGRVLELMSKVVEDGRNAVRGLRSGKDAPQDLDQAFSRVRQELAIEQPVNFRVIVEGAACPLHPVIRDEVYRIGREALANAFRHSKASDIEVELEYAFHQLRVLVRDNGCGMDAQVVRSGRDGHFGLSGMRERAGRIGAKLRVFSRVAGGTEVELCVPGHVAFRAHSSPRRWGWANWLRQRDIKRGMKTRENEREP